MERGQESTLPNDETFCQTLTTLRRLLLVDEVIIVQIQGVDKYTTES